MAESWFAQAMGPVLRKIKGQIGDIAALATGDKGSLVAAVNWLVEHPPAGTPGDDGHTPVLTWSGTRLVIDGEIGPDLQGPPGDAYVPGREVVSFTSGTLANNAVETGTVALGMRFDLLRASASAACRLRLYQTAAHRTADAGRAIGVKPVGDHGVIADIYFVPGALDLRLPPLPPGANLEDTPTVDIPYSLQNLSGGAAAITIDLLRLRLE
jgi:hypothetical protein